MTELEEGLEQIQEGYKKVDRALRQSGSGLSEGLFQLDTQERERRLGEIGLTSLQLTLTERLVAATFRGFQRVGLGLDPGPVEGKATPASLSAPAETEVEFQPNEILETAPVKQIKRGKARKHRRLNLEVKKKGSVTKAPEAKEVKATERELPVFGVERLGKKPEHILTKYSGRKALAAWEMLAFNSDVTDFRHPDRRSILDTVYPGQNKSLSYPNFYILIQRIIDSLKGELGVSTRAPWMTDAINDLRKNPLVDRLAGQPRTLFQAGMRMISFEETLQKAGLTAEELRALVLPTTNNNSEFTGMEKTTPFDNLTVHEKPGINFDSFDIPATLDAGEKK